MATPNLCIIQVVEEKQLGSFSHVDKSLEAMKQLSFWYCVTSAETRSEADRLVNVFARLGWVKVTRYNPEELSFGDERSMVNRFLMLLEESQRGLASMLEVREDVVEMWLKGPPRPNGEVERRDQKIEMFLQVARYAFRMAGYQPALTPYVWIALGLHRGGAPGLHGTMLVFLAS